MPIYFQPISATLPLSLESMGNNWNQLSIQRIQGYPYYHWLQTQSGCGEVWIENRKIMLTKNQGILMPPFIPHAYYPKDNWKTRFFTINGTLQESIIEILGTKHFLLSKDTIEFSFSGWLDEVIAVYERQGIQPLEISQGIYSFLLYLSSIDERQYKFTHPLFQQYVHPVITKIETNYMDELKVEELAKQLYISPQYLTRLFKRFTGKTTKNYLLDTRLIRSKELLVRHPALSIQYVAIKVGFNSASRFTEAFHQKNQLTPMEFRKLHLSINNNL
ncbi:AraC family transcriptional regulator [Melissococcus plutonius]|uniref:Transcriptional regulator n=1 Tax=Melissococcus plutonius TaxID=33970 RepID=A0A2Z5Y062_9ENTE|nr:AraC family transcriptional regulator [Melissococcus plutonius]BAL61334.1 transcriptional regulator [Melissococcus plutonius DAT561]MCV2498736.1 AraC family transcriptional regulator [Melissococcus plutonius]MCV2501382.1 AraC family transcriptional regulator [Melissococcus plutonius]MCV2504984.1 AraC family transcriptional regulator [Melissococcus plutonius]MCV2507352.1 AraC family transcriptional regulator [Melissococcus plutonius]